LPHLNLSITPGLPVQYKEALSEAWCLLVSVVYKKVKLPLLPDYGEMNTNGAVQAIFFSETISSKLSTIRKKRRKLRGILHVKTYKPSCTDYAIDEFR